MRLVQVQQAGAGNDHQHAPRVGAKHAPQVDTPQRPPQEHAEGRKHRCADPVVGVTRDFCRLLRLKEHKAEQHDEHGRQQQDAKLCQGRTRDFHVGNELREARRTLRHTPNPGKPDLTQSSI